MCVKRKELQDFNSLYDLQDYFSSEEICEEYLASIRWNGEPKCPHCESERVGVLQGKTKRYKCYGCRKQFGVKVGTIFHDSKIPLRKWFMAISLIASTNKGMSSHQLARDLNIHQESAWFVLQRIRETYVPSKRKFTKRRKIRKFVEIKSPCYSRGLSHSLPEWIWFMKPAFKQDSNYFSKPCVFLRSV